MLDVVIITFNESLNLPYCLAALTGWTRKVFVVDSGSTDGTQEIARSFGAEVVHHDWLGYAAQKNWALDNLPIESPWVLIVDADEIITTRVRNRILSLLEQPAEAVPENGFFINRLTYFMGRPIRHCGYFPSWNLRLFKRGKGRYEQREVHEHVVIDDPVGYIHEPMIHDDRRGLEHFVAKHNRYSTLEARATFREMTSPEARTSAPNLTLATRSRRWLKRHVSHHTPMPGLLRFLYMYVLRLGFLDGRAGLEFCKFIGMYDYLFAIKLGELHRQAKQRQREADRADALSFRERVGVRGPADERVSDQSSALSIHESPHPASSTPPPSPGGRGGSLATPEGSDPVLPPQIQPNVQPPRPGAPTQMHPESSPWSFREKVGRAIWMIVGRPIFRVSFHNWYGFRAWWLRLFGATIGKGVAIRPTVNVEIPWHLRIEDDATIGDYAILYSLGQITIGKRSIISQYAHLCAGTHDYTDHSFRLIRTPITIGDDAWIGADSFVGPGVHVGNLSVLGARSSAYKDLAEKTVFVGNPARPIKERVLR